MIAITMIRQSRRDGEPWKRILQRRMRVLTCPWIPQVSRITTRRHAARVMLEGTTQADLTVATADLMVVATTDAASSPIFVSNRLLIVLRLI